MNSLRRSAALLLGVVAFWPSGARADLVGTSVTGELKISHVPDNFFDPANGGVPASGYENSSSSFNSTTVPISSTAIEFGYQDASNTDSADFTGTTLTVTDKLTSTLGALPFTMTFTDTAFAGLTLSEISDNFPGGLTTTLIGTTLTVQMSGILPSPSDEGTYSGVFSLTPTSAVPEPSSLLTYGLGVGAVLLVSISRGIKGARSRIETSRRTPPPVRPGP